jgi:hypothetical protein
VILLKSSTKLFGGQARSSGVGSEGVSMDFSSKKKPQFLYINVFFNDFKVAALVDSGSSINIMSLQNLNYKSFC